MANKIQFNIESKEIWAFDIEGQEHYFAKPLDYYIDILNSPNDSLNSISTIDGRYSKEASILSNYFSESALMRYRVMVEVEYLISLSKII